MNKQLLLSFVCGLAATNIYAQSTYYQYKVDLNKVDNDQLEVELQIPEYGESVATFHIPKMVPGTYSIYDFGRFTSNLKAYDAGGKELSVAHDDANTWVISGAQRLSRITYKIEDTWDTDKPNVVFEPAGTNIDKDKVFVFNNHGIFGYLKGKEFQPMQVEVDRPAGFFGGTSLRRVGGDKDTDIFAAESYHRLVDSPIMFCEPDTAVIQVGKTKVLIHTYSPTKRVNSKALVADIKPILEAQREYLGGELPVDNYAFLLFLNPEGDSYLSGAAGALEHSYSSFYAMFEGEPKNIAQSIRDVAAHEFFHIVTPLSIHSEEIHYFDFIDPKMSAHLWMYEGVTEYSAQHVQVKQRLVSIEHFLNQMSDKLRTSEYFNDDIAFTEMSKTCLDKNKDQYSNVYLKGALIGMCIDLKLRSLSKGAYGIQNMMQGLAKKYGIEKPFKDEQLFDEIVAVTGFAEMKDFLNKYVGGKEKLPYAELLKAAGIEYQEKGYVTELSPLGFSSPAAIGLDMDQMLIKIANEDALDEFGRNYIKFKTGDLIQKWNGNEVSLASVNTVLGTYAQSAKEGDQLVVTVLRAKGKPKKNSKKKPKYETVELKATLAKVKTEVKHAFVVDKAATPEQVAIRKAWLGDYKSE